LLLIFGHRGKSRVHLRPAMGGVHCQRDPARREPKLLFFAAAEMGK